VKDFFSQNCKVLFKGMKAVFIFLMLGIPNKETGNRSSLQMVLGKLLKKLPVVEI